MRYASLRDFMNDFYAKVWGTNDADAIDQAIDALVHEECAVEGLPLGKGVARAGFKQFRHLFRRAFQSAAVTIQDCMEDGDRLSLRASIVFQRDGKPYTITGGGFCRVRDGQLVEAYNQWDFLSLATQLGLVPADVLTTGLAESSTAVRTA